MRRPKFLRFQELRVKEDASWRQRWNAVIRILEEHRPCVYFPNHDFRTSCVAPRLSQGIGIIGVIHSPDRQHLDHLSRLGDTWNAVVAVSHHVERTVERTMPRFSNRIRVIPNGISIPDVVSTPALPHHPIRVLYSGRLAQFQKRVLDIAAIAAEMDRRNLPFRWTFAGGGPDEQLLRDSCRQLVNRGVVRFTGVLDPDDLYLEYRRNNVFILTSEVEGLPHALLEAMAHGLAPVVTNIESGISEVVRDEWNGLIAPVGDISSFCYQLTRLFEDRKLLSDLAERSRRTILSGPYSQSRMTASYISLLEEVLAQSAQKTFRRPRGPIRPPAELGPLWRHRLPTPVRFIWLRLREVLGVTRSRIPKP